MLRSVPGLGPYADVVDVAGGVVIARYGVSVVLM